MNDRTPLEGRVALVTGATRGIGKGIAVELALSGATVYFTGRSTREDPMRPGTVSRTADEIASEGGKASVEKLHAQLKQGAPEFWKEVLGG